MPLLSLVVGRLIMGTSVKCKIERCRYMFDSFCTKGEITIKMFAISGTPRYATCTNFLYEPASQQTDSEDSDNDGEKQYCKNCLAPIDWCGCGKTEPLI